MAGRDTQPFILFSLVRKGVPTLPTPPYCGIFFNKLSDRDNLSTGLSFALCLSCAPDPLLHICAATCTRWEA